MSTPTAYDQPLREGITRRCLLERGARSFVGIGLGGVISALGGLPLLGANTGNRQGKHFGRAKNVLVILEQGGLSHMDTWDPKPDAPAEHRSIFKPIPTNTPGMQFTELFKKTAKVADKLAVVRSMCHKIKVDDHPRGTQYILSGEVPGGPVEMPDIGSVAAFRIGSECKYLPPYIMVPGNDEQASTTRTGYLPPSYAVFKTTGRDLSDPNWKVPNLSFIEGIDERRYRDRRDLLSNLDIGLATEGAPAADAMKTFYDQAENLLMNPKTMGAFNLQSEPDAIRDRYGRGHRGQCYLAGRKLIESGVRFVTVDVREPETAKTPGGSNLNWDHHDYIYANGTCNLAGAQGGVGRYGIGTWWMMGSTDQAFSALIEDMDQRGLLKETLVCFVTEFGRTPRLNKTKGRDHWANAYSIAFAGAGIPGGQIIGETDKEGGYVTERPYTPEDYAATVYEFLGIDREKPLHTPDGRPIFLAKKGEIIKELI
jgi:hypothetical protein